MNVLHKNVGEIVAERFAAARVFKRYGIDFCCHGHVSLEEACANAGVSVGEITAELQKEENSDAGGGIPFASWPLDLLIDYVLKIHHRGIRSKGPELLELIAKVKQVHGEAHPELDELYTLVSVSLLKYKELLYVVNKIANLTINYILL